MKQQDGWTKDLEAAVAEHNAAYPTGKPMPAEVLAALEFLVDRVFAYDEPLGNFLPIPPIRPHFAASVRTVWEWVHDEPFPSNELPQWGAPTDPLDPAGRPAGSAP
jgi:hypothetical protein